MDSWHSYPSIFAIGHRALAELLLDPVIVEEKVDGSQFSFGLFDHEDFERDYEPITRAPRKKESKPRKRKGNGVQPGAGATPE